MFLRVRRSITDRGFTSGGFMTLTTRTLERRQFLRGALATAGAAAALPAFQGLGFLGLHGRVLAAPGDGGYGPLVPTPDLRDGVIRIALPEGFQYRSFSPAGAVMSDGNLVPIAHDGMAVFNMSDGTFRLVRNHEDRNAPGAGTTAVDTNAYDARGGGGTTTLIVNPITRELERDFTSLNGTIVNCAGGVTPWGSWITCEETNAGVPQGWLKQHGYCFEVPAAADSSVPAIPLSDMGRFSHEALAVDPETGIVYETEDNGANTSGFYRFLPNTPGVLANGGRLQMLAVDGSRNYNTRLNQTVGMALPVEWVNISRPDPAGTESTDVFSQGFKRGGASFARLEGCWWGKGAVYFNATSGGNAGTGQVWEFRPDGDGGTLTLIFESRGAAELDGPDNLAVSPQGALLLCEDGDADQYLRGLTIDGRIFDFGLNLENDFEWAGATFAVSDLQPKPRRNWWDGVTLFVNRQGATRGPTPPTPGNEGMTFAIWGPWHTGAL
jgi:secreted PhoX family phosphatase